VGLEGPAGQPEVGVALGLMLGRAEVVGELVLAEGGVEEATAALPRGDEPGEMGDMLPTVKLWSDVW